ncbi:MULTISPECIES: FG-GAP repeat domain-containing protein [Streptomyces]|uniref:VCBS repeat-containing protein n=1 Tax=Streptomyces dengpaensis TaxID=2049881 RepID=A0ABM6SSA2_9ACTN|nr:MULTISPECIES: VCBS repeat-containing protein [Streptomyces]AVH57485.1 VCBS repeat-containing protein [Streptomyces dengpaensis]PIB05611.1 histidine kinase [Streptomyces sp. HG99]
MRTFGTLGSLGTGMTAVGCLLLLTACGPVRDGAQAPPEATPVKAAQAPALLPVPHGKGSKTPDDFNGDGRRDLILNDLVKAQAHADDAGIGIVYGGSHGLTPGARQLLSPAKQAAPTKGQLPAVFDAEASCDLNEDGFTDLVVSTDPPYDGQGQPPVPLQILFGSPSGLAGKAVKLAIPAQARFGNDWPDQPVCGDFDGDDANDLVVHASNGQLSYLRGPFSRKGAPRKAGAPTSAPGEVPTGPAADVNRDGYDDLLVRTAKSAAKSAVVLGGPTGPTRTGVVLPAGIDVALARFGKGRNLDAAVGGTGATSLRYDLPTAVRGTLASPGSVLDTGDFDGDGLSELVSSGSRLRVFHARTTGLSLTGTVTVEPPAQGTTRVLTVGDFDGDGRDDLAVRTYAGETKDTVAVYPGMKKGLVASKPAVTFSSSEFLDR